jgi:hypothetical protein
MSKNVALNISGVLFVLVALLHLARLVMKLNVTIGQWELPVTASIGGVIVTAALGVLMFATAAKKK